MYDTLPVNYSIRFCSQQYAFRGNVNALSERQRLLSKMIAASTLYRSMDVNGDEPLVGKDGYCSRLECSMTRKL